MYSVEIHQSTLYSFAYHMRQHVCTCIASRLVYELLTSTLPFIHGIINDMDSHASSAANKTSTCSCNIPFCCACNKTHPPPPRFAGHRPPLKHRLISSHIHPRFSRRTLDRPQSSHPRYVCLHPSLPPAGSHRPAVE